MLATGLRTGEALALRWSDVDPRRINVRRAVSRSGSIGPPKSRAGERSVPIPAPLARDLLGIRAEGSHSAMEDVVFASRSGGLRDSKNSAKRTFARAARAAGAPWATPHAVRHTYASRMVREGCNVKQFQVLLGHATIGVTLDTHAHLFEDELPPALPETLASGDQDRSDLADAARGHRLIASEVAPQTAASRTSVPGHSLGRAGAGLHQTPRSNDRSRRIALAGGIAWGSQAAGIPTGGRFPSIPPADTRPAPEPLPT